MTKAKDILKDPNNPPKARKVTKMEFDYYKASVMTAIEKLKNTTIRIPYT